MSRPRHQLPIVDPAKGGVNGVNPSSSLGETTAGTPPAGAAPRELWDRVRAILELIRPAVQEDGGDVELVEVGADGLVKVRFHGACVGCPSSGITLQTGIERNLREHVTEVTGVIAVP